MSVTSSPPQSARWIIFSSWFSPTRLEASEAFFRVLVSLSLNSFLCSPAPALALSSEHRAEHKPSPVTSSLLCYDLSPCWLYKTLGKEKRRLWSFVVETDAGLKDQQEKL